jgi:hypothetical protein
MKKLFTLFLASLLMTTAIAQIKIIEIYGGGGSAATSPLPAYKNDYVVLKNLGAASVSLVGYTLQYGSATSGVPPATWSSRAVLSGTIPAGECFLIKVSADGAFTGADLPTANLILDNTNSFNSAGAASTGISMSGASGKIALVNGLIIIDNTTAVVDKIGYGTANNAEGTPVAVLSTTTSAKRNGNGTIDTDNNLADFTIGTALVASCSTIPVELVSFTGKLNGKTTLLKWQTATELNNMGFNIQRSNDGSTFQNIGHVKGKDNSVALNSYDFMDETPSVGTNYYRLEQVDLNGKTTTSKTVAVNAGGKGSLKVFPTLATDKLSILTTSDKEEAYQIVNVMGQTVLTGRLVNSTDIAISQLVKGTYFLKVAGETVKFSKQ